MASIAIDAAIVAALFLSADYRRVATPPKEPAITLIDLTAHSDAPEGASKSQTASSVATPPPTSEIDATKAPAQHSEWSMTNLPPQPVQVADVPPVPPAAAAPASGSGTAGNGPGAGYDPYAFASVQKLPPGFTGMAQRPAAPAPIAIEPAKLARLQALLDQHFHQRLGRIVTAKLIVDTNGHIVGVDTGTLLPPPIATELTKLLVGYPLVDAGGAPIVEANAWATIRI